MSETINSCREARVVGDMTKFNKMVQLITENSNISFSDKKTARSFSCTEELERSVIKRFPKSYDKFA